MTKDIRELSGKHKGKSAIVIGKGPSLMRLKAEHIGDGPVIAINDAIITVEKLGLPNGIYSMQKDGYSATPKGSSLIVHYHESNDILPDYDPRYVFDNEKDFGLRKYTFSALTVIEIALLMGCKNIQYICFDSFINGDLRTCISTESGFVCDRTDHQYFMQKEAVDFYLKNKGVNAQWLIP